MKTPILRAQSLSKSYEKNHQILSNINLDISSGETIAIMGASGEGKTTLLHLLAGFESPDSGIIQYKNAATFPKNPFFGFIFQDYHLFEDLSVMDNLLIACQVLRKPIGKHSVAYAQAEQLLEQVAMNNKKKQLVKSLSGGEQQRIAIARALINSPEIIFADEPTGNLDHKTSAQIHHVLLNSIRSSSSSLVVVTHDQSLAQMCEIIYELREGSLIRKS